MTAPLDPLNPHPKRPNSSRKSMDIADMLLKSELVDNGDGRWRYKDHLDKKQDDLAIATRAGCNESYVSRERRKTYGQLVPVHSEEARAARRGKQFGRPFQKKAEPEAAPATTIPGSKLREHIREDVDDLLRGSCQLSFETLAGMMQDIAETKLLVTQLVKAFT